MRKMSSKITFQNNSFQSPIFYIFLLMNIVFVPLEASPQPSSSLSKPCPSASLPSDNFSPRAAQDHAYRVFKHLSIDLSCEFSSSFPQPPLSHRNALLRLNLSSTPSTHIWWIRPAYNSSLIEFDKHPLLVSTDIHRCWDTHTHKK